MVQLVGLLVIGTAGAAHPRIVLGVYVPLIVVAALGAALRMDNLRPVRNDTGAALQAVREPHTWIMSVLYIGTFGSFIGYSFAFGLVLQTQFGRTPLQAASLTFIGPLLGSVIRPVGGRLADRYGGARITLWTFAAMAAATGVVVYASGIESLPVFLVGFIALFVLTGLGNGSTFKMIPGIFHAQGVGKGLGAEEATAYGRRPPGRPWGSSGRSGPWAVSRSTSRSASPSPPRAPEQPPSGASSASTPSASPSRGRYTFGVPRRWPRSPSSAMPRCEDGRSASYDVTGGKYRRTETVTQD